MDARPTAVGSFVPLWFGFEARVDRRAYVVSGLALMVAKWSDAIIHRIHERVLAHVLRLSEGRR